MNMKSVVYFIRAFLFLRKGHYLVYWTMALFNRSQYSLTEIDVT